MPPSSAPPSPASTVPVVRRRSSCGLTTTGCASLEPSPPPPSLAAIHYEPSPTAPSVPAPFSAAKPPTRFGSVGLQSGMFPYRSKTRSRKSLDPTWPRAAVLLAAQREAAEARWLDLPLFPPQNLQRPDCIGRRSQYRTNVESACR